MRSLNRALGVYLNDDGHRVTNVELLFDLVYVFAFTQVTAWIAHEHSAVGTVQGMLMLAILWWTWVAYSWLGNVARADRGALLLGFVAAMTAIFVVALTIRHVWEAAGGTLAPMTFAIAYLVVRVIHALVYAWGARGQPALMRQIGWTAAAWIPAAALLTVGAALPADQRLWWWSGTLALDLAATWILAVALSGWQIRSAVHFAERFSLIVILALGESVVAVGVAAERVDLDTALIVTSIVGVLAAVALWWVYFKDVGAALERFIEAASPTRRVDIARDAYTYLHLPLVAGIILAAAGVEEAVFALDNHAVSGISGTLLAAGVALVCATGAGLLAYAHGAWIRLAVAAAFFASGAFWMRGLNPIAAIAVTAAVLAVVALATPRKFEPE